MIWTRLYDRDRTPAHWTQIVRQDQYVVFICDARSQAPRDAEGRPFCTVDGVETGPCAALCEDAAEAGDFARGVVSRHPELCCAIYDSGGKSRPPVEVIYDPGVRDRYVGSAHGRRLAVRGAALASVGIAMVAIDASRGLAWIWGYVIGLKCVLIGGSFLIRGFIEWREFRCERAIPTIPKQRTPVGDSGG
jgi:hypothetical protein